MCAVAHDPNAKFPLAGVTELGGIGSGKTPIVGAVSRKGSQGNSAVPSNHLDYASPTVAENTDTITVRGVIPISAWLY